MPGFRPTKFWGSAFGGGLQQVQQTQGSEPDPIIPSPAQILRACFVQLGLVKLPVTRTTVNPCYVGGMPDWADFAICLYDGGGRSFGRQARDGRMNQQPGVRVVVRTLDYTGFNLANLLAVACDQRMSPIIAQLPEDGSLHWIQTVNRTTQVVSMGEEVERKRQQWSFNVRIAFQDNESSTA